ncbi:MAG: ParB/RepB/Spo0J family partition protein [Candidatus Eisenbacteria bacterium]|nr:ParB/RepB/Spo0J family partition protein [Candidatus Eisenbacteria bacterium]
MHRKALGRGLEALIPSSATTATVEGRSGGVRELPVSEIGANPFQPRKHFDNEAISELAASIRSTGVLQPVLVRRIGADGYQLVAGERRLRAAGLAGLERIPAVVREVTDREMMELALIENIQRENLNPIEEARAFHALVENVGLTHDQLSERVGKQRSSITNALRLLGLPVEVQDMVSRGTLSAGHARALLGLEAAGDQLAAARYVSNKGFSVRRTEAFVKRRLRRRHSRTRLQSISGLEEWSIRLQRRFGTRVSIVPGRKGGKVEFEYYSQEDLERLFEAWGVL